MAQLVAHLTYMNPGVAHARHPSTRGAAVGGLRLRFSGYILDQTTMSYMKPFVNREKKYYVIEGRLCKLNMLAHAHDGSTPGGGKRSVVLRDA